MSPEIHLAFIQCNFCILVNYVGPIMMSYQLWHTNTDSTALRVFEADNKYLHIGLCVNRLLPALTAMNGVSGANQ